MMTGFELWAFPSPAAP